MLPLSDMNPTRRLPIFTYVLIVINFLVFFWELSMGDQALQQTFINLAVVPARFMQHPVSAQSFIDVVRSMFFHGGWEHILGNMLYLWLFGDNVEDRLGSILYLILYFAGGFIAAFAQVLIDPTSTVPLIGASGAIAAVLGSYLVMFPGVRVRGIIFLGAFGSIQEWPAIIVLGLWFVLQLFNGVASLGVTADYGGVAVFAHIGGFIFGAVITLIANALMGQPPGDQRTQLLYDRANQRRL